MLHKYWLRRHANLSKTKPKRINDIKHKYKELRISENYAAAHKDIADSIE